MAPASARFSGDSRTELNKDAGHSRLDTLLQRSDVWRGQEWRGREQGYPTGFPALDAKLADKGWPRQGICECFHDGPGQGELSLVFPLLRHLLPLRQDEGMTQGLGPQDARESPDNDEAAMVPVIAPPYMPFAPGWVQMGIAVSRLLWIDTRDRKEQLWALEQKLASAACPLVLAWLDKLSLTEARRLQLASEKGQVLGILFLPLAQASEAHPVSLRLALGMDNGQEVASVFEPNDGQAIALAQGADECQRGAAGDLPMGRRSLTLLKRRGGWPVTSLPLELVSPQLGLVLKALQYGHTLSSSAVLQGPWAAKGMP
jgi:hypothetical protein